MTGVDFGTLLDYVARLFALSPQNILTPGKQRDRVRARSVLCFWAVRMLGMTATELAGTLGVSQPAVSNAVCRGGQIVKDEQLFLPTKETML